MHEAARERESVLASLEQGQVWREGGLGWLGWGGVVWWKGGGREEGEGRLERDILP